MEVSTALGSLQRSPLLPPLALAIKANSAVSIEVVHKLVHFYTNSLSCCLAGAGIGRLGANEVDSHRLVHISKYGSKLVQIT